MRNIWNGSPQRELTHKYAVRKARGRSACLALATRTADLLPGGDQAMLYPESEPAAKAAHFAGDLQELLGLTDALGNEVIKATAALLSSE